MKQRYKISKSGKTVIDQTTGLEWQRRAPVARYAWEQARKYAKQLRLNGGGWHLPTMAEMVSIVDYSRFDPAVDPIVFLDMPRGWCWTSTPVARYPSSAWYIYFYDGSVDSASTSSIGGIRCVRHYRTKT